MPRDWPGETVFIVASGPSLPRDLSPLAGRRVIVVKSSWVHWPKADMLFFADGRWWRERNLRPSIPEEFAGTVVTTAMEVGDPRIMKVRKVKPKQMSSDRTCVALARTSTTGAINLAIHLGAARIVLLGVDARLGPGGARHSHGLKWPWPKGGEAKSLAEQAAEYRAVAPSAAKMGVRIVNASPGSAVDAWPRMSFEEAVREAELV